MAASQKMVAERGKNLYRGLNMNGEWKYGSLIHTTMGNTKTWIATSARGNGGWFNLMGRYYVKPKTVGQFTGRHDIKNVPVFEGDFLSCYDRLNKVRFEGYVDFADCSFRINSGFVTHYRWQDYEVIVIGNIHETPGFLNDLGNGIHYGCFPLLESANEDPI